MMSNEDLDLDDEDEERKINYFIIITSPQLNKYKLRICNQKLSKKLLHPKLLFIF